jgi:hypothetical protein
MLSGQPNLPTYSDLQLDSWKKSWLVVTQLNVRITTLVYAENDLSATESDAVPPDDSPWVAAITLWPSRFLKYRGLSKFRVEHAEMFDNPSPNILKIHSAKWANYWAEVDRRAFDATGDSRASIADDPNVVDELLLGAAARTAEIRKKKQRKQ